MPVGAPYEQRLSGAVLPPDAPVVVALSPVTSDLVASRPPQPPSGVEDATSRPPPFWSAGSGAVRGFGGSTADPGEVLSSRGGRREQGTVGLVKGGVARGGATGVVQHLFNKTATGGSHGGGSTFARYPGGPTRGPDISRPRRWRRRLWARPCLVQSPDLEQPARAGVRGLRPPSGYCTVPRRCVGPSPRSGALVLCPVLLHLACFPSWTGLVWPRGLYEFSLSALGHLLWGQRCRCCVPFLITSPGASAVLGVPPS